MNELRNTNAVINLKLSMAADAISRARDALHERDRVTVVEPYSFQQIKRAIHYLLIAYRMSIENSILCDADIDQLNRMCLDLGDQMTAFRLWPDVVDEQAPANPEHTG